uniref:F-box protein At5g52880-like ARM repeats region domain-containing protein n=1 Tax=Oryza glumipatula TaxID=40148 RepID=A0A0E0A8N7_9ORYZ
MAILVSTVRTNILFYVSVKYMICVKRSKYGLLQALQSSLAKQKKAQVVTEFKHSVVAHKWRARVQHKIPVIDSHWTSIINDIAYTYGSKD